MLILLTEKGGVKVTKSIRDSFLERADKACLVEAYVARLFCRANFIVHQFPLNTDIQHMDRFYGAGCFDLQIYDHEHDVGIPIEVKGSNYPEYHMKNGGYLICSERSYFREHGPVGKLPVTYCLVNSLAETRFILAGTEVLSLPHLDRTRGETYQVMVGFPRKEQVTDEKEVVFSWIRKEIDRARFIRASGV